MGKIKLKQKAGQIAFFDRLDKFERVNSEEFRFINNGRIPGIIPVEVMQKRKKFWLTARLHQNISLEEHLSVPTQAETIFQLIVQTLDIAISCLENGLRPESLCWRFDTVWLDSISGKLVMVYLPVVRLDYTSVPMRDFYLRFLDIMEKNEVDLSLQRDYLNYFNQRDAINLLDFFSHITDLRGQHLRSEKMQSESMKPPEPDLPSQQHTMKNVWLQSDMNGRIIRLVKDQIVLGRNEQQCDVLIENDRSISRCHAMVCRQAEDYYLVDLDSTNGTFLNGRRLAPQNMVQLFDGASIRLSKSNFTFHRMETGQTTVVRYDKGGAE